jgi:hypothetical protein
MTLDIMIASDTTGAFILLVALLISLLMMWHKECLWSLNGLQGAQVSNRLLILFLPSQNVFK